MNQKVREMGAIAEYLYLTDREIKRNATIVVGYTKERRLIIHVCGNYERGKATAAKYCNESKQDFTAFDFTNFPTIKHGTHQFRDADNS